MEKNTYSRSLYRLSIVFLSAFLLFSGSCNFRHEKLVGYVYVIEKNIRTPNDILPTANPVTPVVYRNTVSLDTLSVAQKKQKFFDLMLPAILVAKTNLDLARKEIEKIYNTHHMPYNKLLHRDEANLQHWMKKFKTHDLHELLVRMHTFPVSIVLAQAAIESGWGTSRFFLQANNPFGMWSFDPKHQRVAADSTRDGAKVYLRKFDDLEQAIDAYFVMLATGKPFNAFRKARLRTGDPDSLIQTLTLYSERREAYVQDLAKVIRTSHLKKYDTYAIAPDYIRKPHSIKAFEN